MPEVYQASNHDEFDEPETIANPKRRKRTKRVVAETQEPAQDAEVQAETK